MVNSSYMVFSLTLFDEAHCDGGDKKEGTGISHPNKQRPFVGDPDREQGKVADFGGWTLIESR
jgi:hypothetical protein